MRKVYAIEFIEREGEDEVVIFTKPLPDIPIKGKKVKTREDLEKRIEAMDAPNHVRHAVMNSVSFAFDMWFPRNFYRITKVDWKYD